MKTSIVVRTVYVLLGCCLFGAGTTGAQVPHLVQYQGQVTDSQNVPLEGPYTLTFRLYDAATGGTKIWEETRTNVIISSGHFSVLLGSVTSLDAITWAAPCWLSVQVNGEAELAPRQRITSVPLAIRAERAEVAERLTGPVTTSTIGDRVHRTAGDVSTSSTTPVDFRGASITLTTGANPVLVGWTATCSNDALAANLRWSVDVDGTNELGATGINFNADIASEGFNNSFTMMTSDLTAAAHTIKLEWSASTGMATCSCNGTDPCNFWVLEVTD